MLLFSLSGALVYSHYTTVSTSHGYIGAALAVIALIIFCASLRNQRLSRTALCIQILVVLIQLSLPPLAAWRNLQDPGSDRGEYTVRDVLPGRYRDQVVVSHDILLPDCALYTEATSTPLPGDIILTAERPQRPDPESGMVRSGIAGIVTVRRGSVTIYRGPPSPLAGIRNAIGHQIRKLYPPPYRGIVRALLTGTQNEVPKETIAAYRTAGVLHILAASGIHIASVALVPLIILGFLRCGTRMRYAAAALLVLAYLLITDQPASLVRAACMFWTAAGAALLVRHTRAVNTLLLSAALILMIRPGDLFNTGFQFSFLAAGGIILLHSRVDATLAVVPRPLREPLAVSIAAQLPLMPLLYYHFGSINFNALIANLLFVPLSTLLLAASAASLLIGSLPFQAARIPAQGICALLHWAGRAASLAAQLPFSYHPSHCGAPLIALYLCAIASFLIPVRVAWRKFRTIPVAIILIMTCILLKHAEPPPNILYRLPRGAVLTKTGTAWHYFPATGNADVADEILESDDVHSLTVVVSDINALDAASSLLRRHTGTIVLNTRLTPDRSAERLYATLEADSRLRDNAVDFFPKSDSILSLLMDNMDILMRTAPGSRYIDIGGIRYQLIISGEDTNG
jgi:ComEC/Rec2-related protein